jgi:hypothetical protein
MKNIANSDPEAHGPAIYITEACLRPVILKYQLTLLPRVLQKGIIFNIFYKFSQNRIRVNIAVPAISMHAKPALPFSVDTKNFLNSLAGGLQCIEQRVLTLTIKL